MFGALGCGMSCVNKLNRVGDVIEPWGTPLFRGLDLEWMCLCKTFACLPFRKLASQRLSLLCRVVVVIFSISKCLGTVSKALFMSIATIIVRDGGESWLKPSRMC